MESGGSGLGRARAWKACGRGLALIWLGGLLAGCLQPAPLTEDSAVGDTPLPATPTLALTAAPPPDDAPEAGDAGPAILVLQPAGAGTVAVIRYPAGAETCLAASFDLRVLEHTRCGTFGGAGVGFLATLTDPGGQAVRVAYGAVFNPAISAVAVEFAEGGNANAPVQDGGYLLLLQPGQTPRRAVGVNQFGNLMGNWTFE